MPKTTDICIIGGGPAGSVLAVKLAQFGLNVCLIERVPFPRRRLGESLSPGVTQLLASIGVGPAIEKAGYPRARKIAVRWEDTRIREDPGGQGMLVDRGHFDRLLLEHARACGVRVLQPATIEALHLRGHEWSIAVSANDQRNEIEARFVADASGRNGALPKCRIPAGPQTLALHAYWKGEGLPDFPRIEAGTNEWFWGVPLPDGFYNTLVFLDPHDLRAMSGTLDSKFHKLLSSSSLMPCGARAALAGRVYATDATPFLDNECVTDHSIKIGDAALALDPLSSSGVQKAIQTALAASAVVNTLLQRPHARALAQRFYRDSLGDSSTRHQTWARSHYARVAAKNTTRFWLDRAALAPSASAEPGMAGTESSVSPNAPLQLGPEVKIIDCPCLVDRFIEMRTAVASPSLETPVAYLGGLELAPLLCHVRNGITPRGLAESWLPWVPHGKGMAFAQWLFSRNVLVPSVTGERSGP